jgi:AraC-like DNA-binding protein
VGSVFTVSAGQVHANHAAPGGCSFVSVYLDASGLEDALGPEWGSAAALDSVPTVVTTGGAVRSALIELHRVLGAPSTRLEREAALRSLLGTLLPRGPGGSALPGREHRAVSRAEAYLRAHWDRSVSLTELSAASGLSPFHLHRSFSREIGLPPHAFQLQLRVDRAKTLLARGLDIASVAQRTGFADQSHLTRVFRRSVGVTPGRFPCYPGARPAPSSEGCGRKSTGSAGRCSG